jgi:hypothetical protein
LKLLLVWCEIEIWFEIGIWYEFEICYEIEIWYEIEVSGTNGLMANVIVFCGFVLLLRLQFPLDLSFIGEQENPSFISFQI